MVASVAMPKRRWSQRRVVSSGFVVIRRFCRFEGAGGATWSTSASACAMPTMRTSMAARGKAVRSAVRAGHHEITKGMRRTRSIGQDIEWWSKVDEVQIPGTKNALYRAFLDSLILTSLVASSFVVRNSTLLRQPVLCQRKQLNRGSYPKLSRCSWTFLDTSAIVYNL